jgi:DeoR family transcriptional regulator, suf operon transcriptional repressor
MSSEAGAARLDSPGGAANAQIALTTLPITKRALVNTLKKRGDTTVEALAEHLDMTVSGVRQQLMALERDGFVTYGEVRDGPGRPRHVYRLTTAAHGLFPKAYADLTNELLEYVEDTDPELVAHLFERRRERRIMGALERMEALDFDAKIAELTRILDEDGYLADFEQRDDGSYIVTERNCAIFGVALQYGQACGSELDFIRRVLPDAKVERIAHMVAGAHNCSYRIEPL